MFDVIFAGYGIVSSKSRKDITALGVRWIAAVVA